MTIGAVRSEGRHPALEAPGRPAPVKDPGCPYIRPVISFGKVVLRGMVREDVPFLHDWDRREIWPEISAQPWTPALLADRLKEFDEGKRGRGDDQHVPFTVVADGTCVGQVTLWGIDAHNRRAHLGIGLGPEHRGRGYGSDACRALLEYAFIDRGLNRVQLEVLADNDAAIRAYQAAGFVVEGRLRESAWVRGRFADEIVMSVLAPVRSET